MHFRLKKHVIQLIRTEYDPGKKRSASVIVGKVRRVDPVLPDDLREKLTIEEIGEFETWLSNQHHAAALRIELAALQLPEMLNQAAEWFRLEGDSDVARSAAASIMANWQPLRYLLKKNGLLE